MAPTKKKDQAAEQPPEPEQQPDEQEQEQQEEQDASSVTVPNVGEDAVSGSGEPLKGGGWEVQESSIAEQSDEPAQAEGSEQKE